jgi:hypothetical protein
VLSNVILQRLCPMSWGMPFDQAFGWAANSFVLSWQTQWRGVANGEELSGGARNNARCGVQHANGLH